MENLKNYYMVIRNKNNNKRTYNKNKTNHTKTVSFENPEDDEFKEEELVDPILSMDAFMVLIDYIYKIHFKMQDISKMSTTRFIRY